MSVKIITSENFEKEVMGSDNPVLLDFYADWCGPCQMMAPFVHEIADEHPEITVGKINVDEEPALAQKFGIVSIPALFVLKNGEVTNSAVGARPKDEILEMLK